MVSMWARKGPSLRKSSHIYNHFLWLWLFFCFAWSLTLEMYDFGLVYLELIHLLLQLVCPENFKEIIGYLKISMHLVPFFTISCLCIFPHAFEQYVSFDYYQSSGWYTDFALIFMSLLVWFCILNSITYKIQTSNVLITVFLNCISVF